MKTTKKEKYPRLIQLKIPIGLETQDGFSYVFNKDIQSKLNKKQKKLFSNYFGIATCPMIAGKPALYAWDVEAVLERIFSGELKGSQLYWD